MNGIYPMILMQDCTASVMRCRQIAPSICRVIFSFALVLILAHLTFAISLSEYHGQVNKAIAALDRLHENQEGLAQSERDAFIAANVRSAREALPPHESIEWNGTTTATDNSWLAAELNEFEKLSATDPKHSLTLDRILERLQALEERLQEVDKAVRTTPPSKAEMSDRLSTILQRTEYTKAVEGESAFSRLRRGISKWLADLFPKRTSSPVAGRLISQLSAIIAVVLALVAIAYAVRLLAPRVLRNRRAKKTKEHARVVLGEQLEPNQSAADLLAEAEALARSGDLRGAIRRGYIALLVELADRKVLSLAQHKTNRDYLRGVRGIENLYPSMEALTNNFEEHWYGLIPADENDWAAFRAGYRKVSSSEFRVSSFT